MPENRDEDHDGQDSEKLPDPMLDNINTIVQLHARAESRLSRPQRIIEQATSSLGRPISIYIMVGVFGLWAGLNLFARKLGISPWDPWPLYTLQMIVGLVSLVVATMILITENRQSKMDEHHAHLDLQISLVTEQKITKLIALVEELRRDMPNVHDRVDPEADAMQRPADPHAVSTALAYAMDDATDVAAEMQDSSEDDTAVDENGKSAS